ncbi:hypothetical protein MN608_06785 [Microdochium nivale]|nr:hypothetical protein MN608_06785 [Microdochium nivale]
MAPNMDKLERLFTSSRRKEKSSPDRPVAIAPQLQSPSKPLFPSPSFIRPTSISMKPREEERRPSITGHASTHSRQSSDASSLLQQRGRYRHTAPTGLSPFLHLEGAWSPTAFKFPEDSLFKNQPSNRYSTQQLSVVEALQEASKEALDAYGAISPLRQAPFKREFGHKKVVTDHHETAIEQQPEPLHVTIASNGPRDSLSSPIIMPSPISPTAVANALSLFDALPTSPHRPLFTGKEHCVPALPRLDTFSTLDLPHLESPSGSDSEDDCLEFDHTQWPSPASLPTPETFSTRESFDSYKDPLGSAISGKEHFRDSWCARADDPLRSHDFHVASPLEQPLQSARSSVTFWPNSQEEAECLEFPSLWEPKLDEFLELRDDEVAESDTIIAPYDIRKAPTPPPKDTPKIGHRTSTCIISTVAQESVSDSIVCADGHVCSPRPPKGSSSSDQKPTPMPKPVPIRASALISTIATTFEFDEIYIMSFWPDDRKRRGRLLDFPLHLENVRSSMISRRASKSKVAGRLLASYGIEGASGSWELPTDILVEALDTQETWYEYQDPGAPPQALSHGFMCSFYGSCLVAPQHAETANRGIVFAAFHTQSKPIITSGAISDRNLLLADLRVLAKVLVDETIKNL